MKKPETKADWQEFLRQRDEALARVEIAELRAMTDEEAWRRIQLLESFETPWRQNPEWSGLVEQQDLFHRRRKP